MTGPVLIEGYGAIFGVEDLSGDIVRAGAFARSLKAGGLPEMLLQHRSGTRAGRWVRVFEDGRGLFVRGMVENDGAQRLLDGGLDGLSIGFRPRLWKPRPGGGRDLIDLELIEISLVARPMQPRARLHLAARGAARAA